MPDRVTELLFKAVRQLPQEEQDEVLTGLLAGRADRTMGWVGSGSVGTGSVGTASAPPSRARLLSGRWIRPLDPPAARAVLRLPPSTEGEAELRVLPVRLPIGDYERLRAFSREHGFSMAVIIRTLVERFLDGRSGASDADLEDTELEDTDTKPADTGPEDAGRAAGGDPDE